MKLDDNYFLPEEDASAGYQGRLNGNHVNGNYANGNHASVNQSNGNHVNGGHALGHRSSKNDPIAIVGMGCRLPGGSSCPSKLWELLVEARSGHCETPKSRFNSAGFYHPNIERPGSINSTGGYFIDEDVRMFDNGFFGINNVEAKYMDPQQRKLLEVVFECFESAGAPLHELSGSNVGCYVANFTNDFPIMQNKDAENFHRYSATGLGPTILANRISHVFNLQGPSYVLDTACSSSLYALHAACAALDAAECDSAVVAGANLVQSPEMHLGAVKAGILSGTSTCHSFDASADGYGRAEGVGALYLKRLSDAIRDNDPIRSVIRGSAVNSNGKTNGITLPSAAGQEAVIRKAYTKAALTTDETDYIEAHGTGTPVGDPIEVDALSRVFQRRDGRPILIGSVKSGLGHSEAASAISSIIKVTLALEEEVIPPTIGIKKFNPELKLEERNVQVVTKLKPWSKTSPRRAGVNSFGYGGANAHVILEPATEHVPWDYENKLSVAKCSDKTWILPFSAHNEKSLESRVMDLTSGDLRFSLSDLALTLGSRRSNLSTRGFILARQNTLREDLRVENLQDLGEGVQTLKLPLAFVFTGQGAQWAGMGRQLMEEFPTYRRTIQSLDTHLSSLPDPPGWTLESAILEPAETSQINFASHSQPVCTAIQIALVKLLQEWSIKPTAVVGHSSGEIAAAFAAGHLTAAEGIIVAYYRGLLVSTSCMKGAMIAAGLSREEAQDHILKQGFEDRIRVACVNSPSSVTLSGDAGAINGCLSALKSQGVFARLLKTDNKAYHSHHMGLLGAAYEDLLCEAQIGNRSKRSGTERSAVGMVSSVTGLPISENLTSSPAYWRANLESPVLFSDAVETLLTGHQYHLIEVGPHSALELPIKQIRQNLSPDSKHMYSPTLSRFKDSAVSLLKCVGDLYLHGHDISFESVNFSHSISSSHAKRNRTHKGRVIHNLPKYTWHYGPLLWYESRMSTEFRNRKYPRHDLLGSQIPGGPGGTGLWRNILRIKDVPWLVDHKMGQSTVFPATGYLAMAIEALGQLHPINPAENPDITLRHVHLVSALHLGSQDSEVELFTQMALKHMSNTSLSSIWWEFEISSVYDQTSTVHVRGMIGFDNITHSPDYRPFRADVAMGQQAIRTWYGQLAKEGLNFGPSFQSLEEIHNPRVQNTRQTVSKIRPLHSGGEGLERQSEYILHPISMDALLQTGIISSARGIIHDLHGKVPVEIGHARVSTARISHSDELCTIQAVSEYTSFGAVKFDAELLDAQGNSLLQINDVRVQTSPFQELSSQDDAGGDRCPMLRVLWKPDITALSSQDANFTEYTGKFSDSFNSGFGRLEGALDLLAHKNPKLRILEFGDAENITTMKFLDLLDVRTPVKRFKSYTQGSISQNGELVGREISNPSQLGPEGSQASRIAGQAKFDVILFIPALTKSPVDQFLDQILDHLESRGHLLFTSSHSTQLTLDPQRFSTISTIPDPLKSSVTVAQALASEQERAVAASRKVVIVERNHENPFNYNLQDRLCRFFGRNVTRISLEEVSSETVPPKSIVVSTLEIEDPILAGITLGELSSLKTFTDNATMVLWITGGGTFTARRPDFSLVLGLSRSLTLEQPSLKFFIFDIDNVENDIESAGRNAVSIIHQGLHDPTPEFEYLQHNGTLHASRFVPDESMNKLFLEKQSSEVTTVSLQDASRCQLSIKEPGQFDTLRFLQDSARVEDINPGTVEVQVKCTSINAKDLYVLSGRIDTKDSTCCLEFSGVVTRTGAGVSNFVTGDRVVAMAPNRFSTYECVPEWACCKLNDDEAFSTLATIPLVLSTAIYALQDRANLQSGESVLIHAATGGVGIAAIQIAQLIGAEIFATVGAESKKQFLIDTFGLRPDHIFSSRDSTFLPGILEATSGHGVDVVLNSLTGELLHDSWRACAEFGRFVEIGKKDILDNGKLDMDAFRRCTTFTAFDLSGLYNSTNWSLNNVWNRLLTKSIQLLREGKVRNISPLKVFDVSEIVQAYRYFQSRSRIGKVAITLENPESPLQVVPAKHKAKFSADKSYFLVGCLGGIGRSLTKWMLARGARKFVFLGRSGAKRTPAKQLVDDLEKAGAEVTVICGDVTIYSDVERALGQINTPIGGIVQAAMGLDEKLFTEMSWESWHTSVDPKVQGSWNLHNALKGRDGSLDFFLLTSSISGSVGTATESNYCAANAFLDAFARFRRGLGLPAVSIGLGMISEVGYLHEHPDIEALLLRKGLHAINEDELLQICDIALTEQVSSNLTLGDEHFIDGHVLTGFEAQGLQAIREQGFEGGNHVLDDPRVSIMAAMLAANTENNTTTGGAGSGSHLPETVATALATRGKGENGASDNTVLNAVGSIVSAKIRNLLLLKELNPQTFLSKFGMDSMLAAEFRHFIFHTFNVDVPFQTILSETVSVASLAGLVTEELLDITSDDIAAA